MKKARKPPKLSGKEHWFSSDRPIQSARADVLGRSPFAARLAQSICAWGGRDSLVIALQGGWGSGKTSIKNLVLEHLRTASSRSPQIIEFSPWQVSGSGNLAHAFFHELGIALGVSHQPKERLSMRLMSYAKRLNLLAQVAKPVGIASVLIDPSAGAAITAGGIVAEKSAQVVRAGAEASKADKEAAEKSLAQLKSDLAGSLATLPRPVLVVIDDIDRLTTEEILQVFQVVKANADFPNLVYLLLFERSVVTRALDKVSGYRGHEFLQKIVQVDFHVPHAHRRSVEKILFAGLDSLLNEQSMQAVFSRNRWRDLYVDGIANYFQNLRHVYRFLASFGFYVTQFKSGKTFEVNPNDLIGLEALRVFEPELYEKLPSAKRILTRDESKALFNRIKQDEVDRAVEQLLAHVPQSRKAVVRTIISAIFTPINQSFDTDQGGAPFKQQWLRERRVCHVDLFDKYFEFVVSEGDLSQAELDRLLSLTSDRAGFIKECRTLKGRGLLEVAFERLDAYRNQTPVENMAQFIPALCDIVEEFPEVKLGMFEFDLCVYALRLIHCGLLREKDEAKRVAILKQSIHETPALFLALRLVSAEERSDERTQEGYNFLLPESALTELKAVCVEKIKAASAKTEFTSDRNLRIFLSTWFDWGNKSEVRDWVDKHVHNARSAVWLLKTLLTEVRSVGHDGTKVHPYIHLGFLEQFLPIARIEQLTSSLDVNELEKADKIALLELRKALRRRAEGKPDGWDEKMEPDQNQVRT